MVANFMFIDRCYVGGTHNFEFEWMKTGEKLWLRIHYMVRNIHFLIYNVNIQDEEYAFAGGEFSNSVFGFYIEKY